MPCHAAFPSAARDGTLSSTLSPSAVRTTARVRASRGDIIAAAPGTYIDQLLADPARAVEVLSDPSLALEQLINYCPGSNEELAVIAAEALVERGLVDQDDAPAARRDRCLGSQRSNLRGATESRRGLVRKRTSSDS